MRLSGYEYLHNSVPDFNTSEKINAATPSAERVDDIHDDIHKEEKAVTIDFSGSERLHGREAFTSGNFPGTEFSTEDEPAGNTVQEGNSILNQYRFFVRSNHYEGSEGVVRRIFK